MGLDDWDDVPALGAAETALAVEERVITEARRAVEAVVMAAIEPVEPQVLAQLVEIPVSRGRGAVHRARRGVRAGGPRVRARARRRRLPVPDPPRHGAVRRALRARGPDRPAVGPGARDARDRRLQAAGLACAARRDPRRERRVDAVDARAARLRRRRSVTTPARARRSCTAPRQLFLERLGLDSLATCPPLAEFVPEPSVVEALERGLLLRTEPEPEPSTDIDEPEDTADAPTPRPASRSTAGTHPAPDVARARTASRRSPTRTRWISPSPRCERRAKRALGAALGAAPSVDGRCDRPDRRGAAPEGPRPGRARVAPRLRRPDRRRAGHGRR